jgi:hypothetical protein
MVPRVAYDNVAGGGEFRFRLSGYRGVQGGKNEFWTRARFQIFHFQARKIIAERRGQPPGEFTVGFSSRALTGSEPLQAEPWMIR